MGKEMSREGKRRNEHEIEAEVGEDEVVERRTMRNKTKMRERRP